MKAFKILFLNLAILFSFGFTSFETSCNIAEKESCSKKHSCCKKEEKPAQKKDCKGKCCVQQPVALFKFNVLISPSKQVQFSKKKSDDRVLIDFNKSEIAFTISKLHSGIKENLLPFYSIRRIERPKLQSWII